LGITRERDETKQSSIKQHISFGLYERTDQEEKTNPDENVHLKDGY